MRSAILTLLAFGWFAAAASSPAAAHDYPYCIQSEKEGTVCAYTGFDQCMAAASGRGVDCIVNPVVAFGQQNPQTPPPRQRHARRASDY